MDLGRARREAEFVAFVREEQRRLRRVAFAMCGDWHRAEDIVQSALTKLYVHWGRVDRDLGAWAYARRAVVNTAIDESRRPWRREIASDTPPDGATPVESDLDDDLAVALAALPARQRAVVVLRYVEDLDVDTVAGLLQISSGTVKSQAARGLEALRTRLGEPGRISGGRL